MLARSMASIKSLEQSPTFLNRERQGLGALAVLKSTQPEVMYYLKAIASNNACKNLPLR
jgi:hypothetical protein